MRRSRKKPLRHATRRQRRVIGSNANWRFATATSHDVDRCAARRSCASERVAAADARARAHLPPPAITIIVCCPGQADRDGGSMESADRWHERSSEHRVIELMMTRTVRSLARVFFVCLLAHSSRFHPIWTTSGRLASARSLACSLTR